MYYLLLDSTDPYYNLAAEEHLLKTKQDEFVMLWQNDNTIVVGKHQNTAQEINDAFVREHDVRVVRRNTGGGAVYHDLGNLNYSVISNIKDDENLHYANYAKLVVDALASLGVAATLSGRNDILIDEKKISGTAQQIHAGRVLHHGTLLLESNMSFISGALNVSADKFQSKSAKSVKSRVGNINDFLENKISMDTFKATLIRTISLSGDAAEYTLTKDDLAAIDHLWKTKYQTWDWNFGKSPASNYTHAERFSGGKIEVSLLITAGKIEECKIYGDFMAMQPVSEIEERLRGTRYDYDAVEAVLQHFDLPLYFGTITEDELMSCFFE